MQVSHRKNPVPSPKTANGVSANVMKTVSRETASAMVIKSLTENLKLYRRKLKLSKLFLGFTEMEAAWKEFRTIYSVKEYLLPLGKHNGAEMY